MTGVGEIERAVELLPPEDLAAFRTSFERFEAGLFDSRIEADALVGRLDRLAEEALAERRQGALREL